METTMRKEWGSPKGNVQMFTPQEFVAACIPVSELGDGSWHFDMYTMGTKGRYDGQNNERISGAWGPAALKNHGGETFTVDVYRYCTVNKPVIQAGDSYPGSYTPNHNHRWASDGPNGGGYAWTYYDGYTSSGWNYSAGHFVKVAEGATLKMSASGQQATLYADLSGVGFSGGTSAS